MVPEWGTLKSQQKAAVKGGRRPAKRTLEGCVLSHPRHLTMGLAGRPPQDRGGSSHGQHSAADHGETRAASEVICRRRRLVTGSDRSQGRKAGSAPPQRRLADSASTVGSSRNPLSRLAGCRPDVGSDAGRHHPRADGARGECQCGCSTSLSTRGGGPGCSHRRGPVGTRCIRRRGVCVVRGMTTTRHRGALQRQPPWAALLMRAADQDRTGIISLEGR
jgi:hypothetical protein